MRQEDAESVLVSYALIVDCACADTAVKSFKQVNTALWGSIVAVISSLVT